MLLNPYRFGAAAPSTFYDLIMAQGPVNYWRNGESSGSVMVDQVAANGAYLGAVSLGNAALYPGTGALTTAGGNFGPGIAGSSTAFPSSLASMTLITIIRPTNLTSFKLIGVQRDEGSASVGARKYQWRSNGAAMEFVKIIGGITTISQASMLAINTTYLLAFEVDSSGNYAMYRNGVAVKTGTMPAGDYGGAGEPYRIGYCGGAASNLTGRTCENAVFNKALGPTVHAALFAATGL